MLAAMTMPAAAVTTVADLAGSGWTHGAYEGVRPGHFLSEAGGALRIEADATGSFVWRRLSGVVQCLSWRWSAEFGPATRAGDDGVLALAVGFAGFPPRAGAWPQAQHAIAQGAAGGHILPRAVLIYLWGGAGRDVRLYAPWLSSLGHVRPMRRPRGPAGTWFEERVDLDTDWRAVFGGDPPLLQEIAIACDVSDTRSRLDARIEAIRLQPC